MSSRCLRRQKVHLQSSFLGCSGEAFSLLSQLFAHQEGVLFIRTARLWCHAPALLFPTVPSRGQRLLSSRGSPSAPELTWWVSQSHVNRASPSATLGQLQAAGQKVRIEVKIRARSEDQALKLVRMVT